MEGAGTHDDGLVLAGRLVLTSEFVRTTSDATRGAEEQ